MAAQRFPILFTGLNRTMALIGVRPANSYVEVGPEVVTIRMGAAFRAGVPRRSVRSAALDHRPVRAWGAHGWRGRWLVNGSSENVVRVEIDPVARAHVLGFPVMLRELRASMVDPQALIAALAAP